jgi:hypothetical protein
MPLRQEKDKRRNNKSAELALAELEAKTLSTTHPWIKPRPAWPPSNPIDDKVAAQKGKPVKGLVLGQVKDLFRRATHGPSGWI